MAGLAGKAKVFKHEGHCGEGEYKKVSQDCPAEPAALLGSGLALSVKIVWQHGQLIRFSAVDQLIDFLKKSA